ncbi:glycosyltransferase family 2 protein [Winogradskyella sp. A3E31]|uniref:glycosyltransferase family 2 protein n=1 Tax=Winogradskyella sp. A3E31 TaxID=3349637 RepID=UPI00398B695F
MLSIKDIAIVILNWNGKDLLETFLPSVTQYSEGATIYIADNASTDDSVDFITSNYPEIKIIQNSTNEGYAKGYNDALKHVDESIYCLLNSDIEVTPNWLQPIINTFNSDSETVIIQPKILDYNNRSFFEYAGAAGGFIDKYGYPFCRGRIFETIEKDTGQYNDTIPIFWASGACFFIRKSAFEGLNGFDASYFAHMEEIDLCWRAFNQGHVAKYVEQSTVFHVGGATLKSSSSKKTYLNFRNSLITLVKNTDRNVFFRTVWRMKLDGIAAFRFLIQGKPLHFWAIVKAHLSFYGSLSRILKQRKSVPKRYGYYKTNSIVWSYFIKQQRHF